MVVAVAALAAAPRPARAECDGDPKAERCGNSCYDPAYFQCCIDLTASQWLCVVGSNCGKSAGKCAGGVCDSHSETCVGCNAEFGCPPGTECNPPGGPGFCAVSCPGGKYVCGIGQVCTDDGCCNAATEQVCGGKFCAPKEDICCDGYSCKQSHICGPGPEQECISNSSSGHGGILSCTTVRPGSTHAPLSGVAFLLLGGVLWSGRRLSNRRPR